MRLTRLEHGAAGPYVVGQSRQTERHAFPGIAFGLAIERLMLAKLLEQDHRQQAGPHQAARDYMERCRRLADLLAIPARELLADILDDLPLPRDRFQRLGDRLPKLAQPAPTAAKASGRPRHDHAFPRQMFGEGLARGALACERRHRRGLRHRLLGGDLVVAMEGAAPKRVAITEWDSLEKAEAFYNSTAWKDLAPQRDKAVKTIRRYAVEALN
jgi:hypothetical protein